MIGEPAPPPPPPPPRVVIVMPDQWRRALLRAALREDGYDAIGARELREATLVRSSLPDRGPVRLIVIDQDALGDADLTTVATLRARHRDAVTLMIAHATTPTPDGPWERVLRRPLSVADIVSAAEKVLPLPPELHHSID